MRFFGCPVAHLPPTRIFTTWMYAKFFIPFIIQHYHSMRYLLAPFPVLLLSASLFSCGGPKGEVSPAPVADSAVAKTDTFDVKAFEGEYVGDFGDGHIVLVISYVQGKNASGYNVHKGLRRNIKGTLTQTAGEYRFVLTEPGDNKYDGVFEFTLNPADFTGQGQWTPNNKAVVKAKSFRLEQRRHNPETENRFVGYWDGPEMLNVREDGIVEMTYWQPIPGTGGEESEQRSLRGQWLADGDALTIEWPQNPHNKGEKYVLYYTEDEGYAALVDKAKKREYYQYGY